MNLVMLATLLHLTPDVREGSWGEGLAEIVATQVAVAWNFALTEQWVFTQR